MGIKIKIVFIAKFVAMVVLAIIASRTKIIKMAIIVIIIT